MFKDLFKIFTMKLKVGILGATGYTGAELTRLLVRHPRVEIIWLTSEKFSGKKISEVFPHFRNFLDLDYTSVTKLSSLEYVDLSFSCLPHGKSMFFVNKLLDRGIRVIDFSADFRFVDHETYERLYRVRHPYRELLREAVYGLPEIHRSEIKGARIIANPGCFSTSVIFGLAPLVSKGLIKEGSINVDSKAGLAGAGRAPTLELHFSESNETAQAFGVNGHDQKPEMEQELSSLNGGPINIVFVPHRIPVNRGILTTIYSRLEDHLTHEEIREIYHAFYEKEFFVRLYVEGKYPSLKNVRFTNFCDIGLGFQEDVLISVVALDNLGKGAAGQAVQNMNIMFDFPEVEGLRYTGAYP